MKIVVEISDDEAMYINRVIELANMSDANTHGTLGFEKLTKMLLEDVAMIVRRPGSWEGGPYGANANLSRVRGLKYALQ